MGSEQLITQYELDVLTSSMEIAQKQAGLGQPAEVALYDFTDATTLSPDQIHELNDHCEVLAKVLTRTLSAYLTISVSVIFEGLDRPSLDQYIRGLPPNPILATFQLDPHSPPAVWQIDNQVAVCLINSMLGASEPASPPPSHDLTPIEAALLKQLFNEILQTWSLTWPALNTLTPSIDQIVTTVASLDISSHAQQIVHAVFRFSIADLDGSTNLALPLPSFQHLLRTTAEAKLPANKPTRSTLNTPICQHTFNSTLTIAAQIAKLRLPLRSLSNLQPGDVLPLDRHPSQPLTITVAGIPKFYAEPGRQLSHLAARITKRIGAA